MLTIREAQQRTGLSELTVRRRIIDGTIQAEMLDGTYYIEESELSKLPKPRKGKSTQSKQSKANEKVEVPEGIPFPLGRVSIAPLKSYEKTESEKWKAIQEMSKAYQMALAQ